MFRALYFIVLLLFVSCQDPETHPISNSETEDAFAWDMEKEKIHNENRSDSSRWSAKNWETDTGNLSLGGKPFVRGVFPVPNYDLEESGFDGLGYSGDWKGIDFRDKKIIYHSLFVNKNNINARFIKEKPNEVYFSIVVLTDSVDLKGYTHTNVDHTSRNHPHFVGQGFVKTKSNQIDFMSFQTADRKAYAVVNMRLFDLRIGRIVLIAPQMDGTLRSLQLDAPIMSSDEMDAHIQGLLGESNEVKEFFSQVDNI